MKTEVVLKNKILKSGSYDINVYDEGKNLFILNLPSGKVYGNKMITLSCGCCSDYEDDVWDWNDLCDDVQDKILESIDVGLV